MVDGVKCGITRQGWTSYQYPFNLTGHPALAVPSGFGADHLPTSVQIVGKWGCETDVLRLGALLEAGAAVGAAPAEDGVDFVLGARHSSGASSHVGRA